MKFIIEQVAIATNWVQTGGDGSARARKLLEAIGLTEWVHDHVVAQGQVFGEAATNEANLSFNYDAGSSKPLELELLNYTRGTNWVDLRGIAPGISHLGMHCTEDELFEWRALMRAMGIEVAQEVETLSHTNPAIKDTRRYRYVIFNTRPIIGVDLKFIVRRAIGEES